MAEITPKREGDILYGLLENSTGEANTYQKVTRWADGRPMGDYLCDGALYRKSGNEYFRRTGPLRVNVLSLGLKNDDSTPNQLVFAQALAKLPTGTTFFFPAGTYYFDKLPAEFWTFNIPCGMNLTGSNARLEGEPGTVLRFGDGQVGIQYNAGVGGGIPSMKKLNILGPGWSKTTTTDHGRVPAGNTDPRDAGRAAGEWSLNPDNYFWNGLNMWGQMNLEEVKIHQFKGHGVCNFGDFNIRIPGLAFTMEVRVESTPDGYRKLYPLAGSPSQVSNGWSVRFPNVPGSGSDKVRGITADWFGISNVDEPRPGETIPRGFPESGTHTVAISPGGGALIADYSNLVACDFDQNAGAGFYCVGADGNQHRLVNCSFILNGWWGCYDNSFLGIHVYGAHFASNGANTREYAVDGIFGNDVLLVGGYTTVNVNARSTWVGCYTESDQAPSWIAAGAMVVGGLQGVAVLGPGLLIGDTSVSSLSVGDLGLSKGTLTLARRDPPFTSITGVFSNNNGRIRFTVQDNPAVLSQIGPRWRFFAYAQVLTVVSREGANLDLGPLIDFYPPTPLPSTPTSPAQVAPPSRSDSPPLRLHEFKEGDFGFGYFSFQVGQMEQRRLAFKEAGSIEQDRKVATPGVAVDALYLGGFEESAVANVAELLAQPNRQFRTGDSFRNRLYTGRNSRQWVCVLPGTTKVLASSFTATKNGPTLRFSVPAEQTGLEPGDVVAYGSQRLVIGGLIAEPDGTSSTYVDQPNFPSEGTQTITTLPPVFTGVGPAQGPLSQRPTDLTVHDTGLSYYATDTGSHFRWDGDSWNTRGAEQHTVDPAKQISVAGGSFPQPETNPDYFGKEFTLENGTSYTAYCCRRVGTTTTWKWYRSLLQ